MRSIFFRSLSTAALTLMLVFLGGPVSLPPKPRRRIPPRGPSDSRTSWIGSGSAVAPFRTTVPGSPTGWPR